MLTSIEPISFGLSTVLFFLLSLVMLTGQRDNLLKLMLAIASLSSAVWSGFVTYQSIYGGLEQFVLLLELLRSLAWFSFLLVMLRTAYSASDSINKNFKITFLGLSIFIIGLMFLGLFRISGGIIFEPILGDDLLLGHLLISIGG
ncbi:hypothetical protein MNBD_GAMMA07-2712, partial [hydrothermal vent metagenome]